MRNFLMGKFLKFQMIVRQIWMNFSDDKISICFLLSFVLSWLWLSPRTMSMKNLSKVKKALDFKGGLVSQAPVPHENPSFQAGRCQVDDSKLILMNFHFIYIREQFYMPCASKLLWCMWQKKRLLRSAECSSDKDMKVPLRQGG